MGRFVNLTQTPEERQEKYNLAISLGVTPSWARRIRDWRLTKIERSFHLAFDKTYRNAPVLKPYAQFLLPGFTPNPLGPNPREQEPL